MKTVMILFGGQSSEHEVSRVSARNVLENIDREKFHVVNVGITKDGEWLLYNGPIELMDNGEWQELAHKTVASNVASSAATTATATTATATASACVRSPVASTIASLVDFVLSFAKQLGYDKIDVVFPVMHGINCEDGTIQGLLELCNLPYVGSGVLGSAMSMDKDISKLIFEKAGIPQGKYFCVDRQDINIDMHSDIDPDIDPDADINPISKKINEISQRVENEFGFPCFVKPANAGSSVGVSKARNSAELVNALAEAARFDKKILIEQFIDGREIECAVLGNNFPKASPLGEIIPSNDFYDYTAKYIDNSSACVIPAKIPEETATKIKEYAVLAFKELQCFGLSRVDFFLERNTGEIFINEINTIPGFTSISMYPLMWQEAGLSYTDLISTLLELAIERFAFAKRAIDSL